MPGRPKPVPPICTTCGGSGTAFDQWGPFYALVERRWRPLFAEHIAARHEAFRDLDRLIAEQVVPLEEAFEREDVFTKDILAEIDGACEKGMKALLKGDSQAVRCALQKMAASAVYLLEALQIELNRAKPQD